MPPNVHCSLFLISLFCVYSVLRHITWKLQVMCGSLAYWTTAILSHTFFAWFRVALEMPLEIYGQRHASVVLWYDTCAHTASLYIHRYLVRSYIWQLNSPTLWLHTRTTHQVVALLPTMHHFIRTKLASYTTHYNFNQSSMLLLKLPEVVLSYLFMSLLSSSQKKNRKFA